MKTRTFKLICTAILGTFVTMPIWARAVFCPSPPDNPKGKLCSNYASETELDVTVINLQLKYDPEKYPFSKNEFGWYHLQPPGFYLTFSDIVNFRTEELPPDRRSFIKVIIQGASCTGTIESRLDKSTQVMHNVIRGVKYFNRSAGDFKDTRIIANSIVSGAGERLVWTKTYSHSYLKSTFQNWVAEPDGAKKTVKSNAVVQYPHYDSTYLNDDSWITNPVYNNGDFNTGGSGGNTGGGGTIDPEPYDSLHFL